MRQKSEYQLQGEEFARMGGNTIPDRPQLPPEAERLRLARLLLEEFVETIESLGCCLIDSSYQWIWPQVDTEVSPGPNLEKIIDGCGDVRFVTNQILSQCGIGDNVVDAEVCRSNLTKYREGWYRDERGKVIKSPLYEPADMQRVIRECGGEA